MEFQYQHRKSDCVALYENQWRHLKRKQRSEYYTSIFWLLCVLALGAYVALKHDELFIAIIFGVLATIYLRQHWSFERGWKSRVDELAILLPESRVTVVLDDAGLVEVCGGIRTQIDWAEFSEYSFDQERLFLRYRNIRGLAVPLEGCSEGQLNELVAFLESHGVPKQVVKATAS